LVLVINARRVVFVQSRTKPIVQARIVNGVTVRFQCARQQAASHTFHLQIVERFAQGRTSLCQLVEKFWQRFRLRSFRQMMSPEHAIDADEAIPLFLVQEVEQYRRPDELGEQLRQQATEQLVVVVLDYSGLHASGNGDQANGDQASGMARQVAQQNLQGRVADVRRVARIPRHGLEQRIEAQQFLRRCDFGQPRAVVQRIQRAVEQGDVGLGACGVSEQFQECRHHVGRGQSAERYGGPVLKAEMGIALGFGFERGEHAALVIDREVAHIAIEHDAKWIAFDEFGARAAAMYREPSGYAAQVGHDAAVLAGHECNDATERQALSVDQGRQMPSAEVFGDAAMDRDALLFAVVALKQAAGQRIEQWCVTGGGKLAPETVLIVHRVFVEGKAGDTREQLHGAEETCRVEQGIVRPCAGARRRTALRVGFAHQ